jgi:hypothetical protein
LQAISNRELALLERASNEADEQVRNLLSRDIDEGRYGPQLKSAGYIGTYVLPPVLSWESLDATVGDPHYDVDFSITQYPDFDGVVQEHFQSDQFINPLNSSYEKWGNLRHNIACVRNFLLIEYFEANPRGRAITDKEAEDRLEEISAFVGKGLYNNYRFLGMVPNHNPLESFVDIDKANQPGADGARYIYERILQKDRQSNWLRPFNPIISFFTGDKIEDWDLPSLHETPFYPGYEEFMGIDTITDEMVEHAIAESRRLKQLLSDAYRTRDGQTSIRNAADDLNGLGNQLLFSAASAHHVAGLQEPVRRNAIDIAKDILNKLKIQLGSLDIQEGLNLNPQDDVAAVGALKGVMLVYEKLLAHARNVDASVLNHPAVIAATQAFGHIGYLAKAEAMRFAVMMGDEQQVGMMRKQLERIPEFFAQSDYQNFGDLITRIETGFDVVLNRVQQITSPSALISNSQYDTVGRSMSTPTAGLQSQIAAAIGVQGNMRANQAAEQAAQLQAQQMTREHARKSGGDAASLSGSGRAALSQAKKATKTGVSPINTNAVGTISSTKNGQKQQQQNAQTQMARQGSEKFRRAVQGINPLLLKSMRDAQVRAAKMANTHHDHDEHLHHPDGHHHDLHPENAHASATGIRPDATPSRRGTAKSTSMVAGGNESKVNEVTRRREDSTLPGGHGGRTI